MENSPSQKDTAGSKNRLSDLPKHLKSKEIAERLILPEKTLALLFDLDGVLLDTLGLDVKVCNQLLQEKFGDHVQVSKGFIKSIFAYHPPLFWQYILEKVEKDFSVSCTKEIYDEIYATYDRLRHEHPHDINPGIKEILSSAREAGLKVACVSNNPGKDVNTLLEKAGISAFFDLIVGNDIAGLKKKPEPDTYLYAAESFGLSPENCVVIEDSLVGAQAGKTAGCHTIGVATGGAEFVPLCNSPHTDMVYTWFAPIAISLHFGDVTQKEIQTPNDFISHMIEHIAWRMGFSITLFWNNNDWKKLGMFLGNEIRKFPCFSAKSHALGMIDDGSAEACISLSSSPGLDIKTGIKLDMAWFLSLRAEQAENGIPMKQLLEGLSTGTGAKINILVPDLADPHHTWEGIFRAVGTALSGIFRDNRESISQADSSFDENTGKDLPSSLPAGLVVKEAGAVMARIERRTSESLVQVRADFSKEPGSQVAVTVSDAIQVQGIKQLLQDLSIGTGVHLDVNYKETRLSSSHVALEDIGLVVGRAMKEIMVRRMMETGVNGAGSSPFSQNGKQSAATRVGISVEGRKFVRFYPVCHPFEILKTDFLVGHTVYGDLFSEDIDDFIDGLANGFSAGIVVHFATIPPPDAGWREIIRNLGLSLKEAFAENPRRKGVPPGVKATLA